jgi:proteasome lid subunit RPN8/RPN11
MAKERNPDSKTDPPATPVNVQAVPDSGKPLRRTFPGPQGANARLRVAIGRSAYAELVAHAKSSLEAEVCGVLAGHVCEDDEGPFVNVEAIIRGTAASQASTHVTFTQETWNVIYQTLERDFPKLKIVGWYHTHPGFGVEFSEMDLFIQRNFFSGPTHLALVTDPVNGHVAVCVNTPQGIQYLERFWVDGREQACRVPARQSPPDEAPAAAGAAGSADKLQALEARVAQLVQALDDLRGFHYRFMLTCGFLFCLALIIGVGYTIRKEMTSHYEPPRLNSYVPVPVQIGDKTVLIGVGVASWEVPPELNALMLQAEILKQKDEQSAKGKDTNASPVNPANPAPATNRPSTPAAP